jgi:hypothetical protein
MGLRYIVHPEGMANYRYVGPTVGFSYYVQDQALQYVSEFVAQEAIKVIDANIRRDFPNAKKLTYRAILVPD